MKKGGVSLHSANGSNMDVVGKILLDFKIHGLKFQHEFIVVKNLSRSAILGRDFLGKHKARLYYDLQKIRLNGVYIPLENDVHLAATVRAASNVCLQPQTTCFMTAAVKDSLYFPDEKEYSFAPSEQGFLKSQPELTVASALVRAIDRKVPVQVTNTSNKLIRIRKGCVLGKISNFREIESETKEVMVTEVKDDEFTQHIKVDSSHRSLIEPFLLRNKSAFAFSDLDLDTTDLGVADIDTGDHRPISLRPYRIPLAQREVVSKTIDDLLEAGIITRSNSPWNFPIVLVEKKPDNPNEIPKKRMCVDFRALNQIVDIRSYPIPLIDDILANLKGTTYFTTLDL